MSNIGQADGGQGALETFDQAQEFTTGDNSSGYTLTSVEINLISSGGSDNPVNLTVAIWSRSDQGQPMASLGTLTHPTFPSVAATGVYEFTTSGIDLEAETAYLIVLDSTGLNVYNMQNTASDSEDSGGESGWEIGNSSLFRSMTATGNYSTFAESKEIRINGTVKSGGSNNAPTASNGTVTTNEDTAHTFSASEFSFMDTDSGDTLSSVRIVTLPASGKGTLALDGTAVTANDVIPAASIGNLTYTPPSNANGTGYASFTFKVSDGSLESTSSYTMTINVTAVNDAPSGKPTISGTATVGQTLTASASGISDADGLSGVTYGYQWVRVDGGDSDISGATSSTYTLQSADEGKKVKVKVSFIDQGGTSETVTSDAYPSSGTIGMLPLTNNAPTASNGTVTTNEDTAHTFSTSEFNFSDTDSGDTLSSVKIVTLPASGKGTLRLSGTAVTANQVVAAASIGNLTYTPPANENGTSYASFTFKVSDGSLESTSSYTMTINVTAVNDAPSGKPGITGTATVGQALTASASGISDADGLSGVTYGYQWVRVDGGDSDISGATSSTYTLVAADEGKKVKVKVSFTDNDGTAETVTSDAYPSSGTINRAPTASDGTVTTNEDTAHTFSASEFSFMDTDSGDTLSSVRIVTLPASGKGTLALDGTAVTANDVIPAASIGNLTYTPPSNANGTGYASFTFKVSDGSLESTSSYTMTINVTAVNDAPSGKPTISGTATVGQTLTASASGISDADGLSGVTYGYQWVRVDGGDSDISGATSSTYTLQSADEGKKVKVKVSFIDQGGTSETVTSDAYPSSGTIGMLPLTNNAPTASNGTVTTNEDTAHTFSTSEFNFSDTDSGDTLSSVKIVTLPASGKGTLRLSGTAVTANQVVAAASIGNLTYTPPANENGTSYASFTFKVSDGSLESTSSYTMTINVTAVNDAPSGKPGITGTATVGQALTASASGISDADGLSGVTYGYQWVRVDGGDSDISGATSSTYTLVAADEGKKVKVKVSFTDNDGTAETVTSDAYPSSGTINRAPTVVSVAVTSTPAAATDTYGAGEAIRFTVTFSEAVEVSPISTRRPHFEFALGNSGNTVDKEALYDSGTGTAALTFAYTVQSADMDNNGIWIGDETRTIKFDTGEYIRSVDTELDADLDHSTPGTQADHKVNGSLAVDMTPPTLPSGSSVVNGTMLVLTFSEALDETSVPDEGDFEVTVGTVMVTVTNVNIDGNTVTLTLASAALVGQAVTVEYLGPDSESDPALQDLAENKVQSFTQMMVTNNTNSPATGAPTITGTPTVGQILTASASGISDANGLSGVSYSYQWVRVDGGDSDISGATSSTYTLQSADAGKKVKVKVSFTDDAGNPEGPLTSDAYPSSGTVEMLPLTNNAPTASNGTVTTNENTAHTFSASEFNFSDTDIGNTLSSVRIVTLPASGKGTLALSGTAVTANQVVAAASTGNLTYTPPSNSNGTGYASFTFKVSDGMAESASSYTMTINVTAVNEGKPPPVRAPAPPPVTVPGVPSDLAAAPGDGEVTLTWSAPDDGGSPIERYEYRRDDGDWISTAGISTSHTLTGLSNGRTYEFSVRAVNGVGAGAGSGAVSVMPVTVPGAPSDLAAVPGDGEVTLTWSAPDDGGAPIERYEYRIDEGDWISTGGSSTSHTLTGLSNGRTYSFRVRAVNEIGAGEASAEVTAEVISPVFRRAKRVGLSVLPEFGRTMAKNLIDALTWRFKSALSGSSEGTGVFGVVGRGAVSDEIDDPENRDMWEEGEQWRELGIEGMFYGSSFIVEAGGMPGDEDMFVDEDEKPVVTEREGDMGFWGKVDYSSLSVGGSGVSWDGRMTGGHVGIDRRVSENVLLGISASLTRGSFDYSDSSSGNGGRGDYGVRMRSVSPYAAWLVSEDVYLWGAVSYGRGSVKIDDERWRSGLSGKSLSAGGSTKLFDIADTVVSLRGEAFKVWMDVEGDRHMIDDLSVGVYQARLGVEGIYEYRFASGARFSPVAEIGVRRDGGDGRTGAGFELGGGFVYENPDMGLSVSGRGRWLGAHGSGEIEQWGAGGEVVLDAGVDGRGASLRVSPVWGEASSGVENLWERGVEGLSSVGSADMRVDAEFGYGLAALGGKGLFTPYGAMGFAGGGRRYRVGSRLDVWDSASVSLETERSESDSTEPEHGILLRGELSF